MNCKHKLGSETRTCSDCGKTAEVLRCDDCSAQPKAIDVSEDGGSVLCDDCAGERETKSAVARLAKKAAAAFVSEFGEALDPTQTDWDSEAWATDSRGLGLTPAQADEHWEAYQQALVAHTQELANAQA